MRNDGQMLWEQGCSPTEGGGPRGNNEWSVAGGALAGADTQETGCCRRDSPPG